MIDPTRYYGEIKTELNSADEHLLEKLSGKNNTVSDFKYKFAIVTKEPLPGSDRVQIKYTRRAKVNGQTKAVQEALLNFNDIYMSLNPKKNTFKLNTFAYTMGVIDIDSHSTWNTKAEDRETALSYIRSNVVKHLEDKSYPIPCDMVDSGRGLHLFFNFKSMNTACSMSFLYEKVMKAIAAEVTVFIEELAVKLDMWDMKDIASAIRSFAVDNATLSGNGNIRVPGTFNTKAGTFARTYNVNDNIYDLIELNKQLQLWAPNNDTRKRKYFCGPRVKNTPARTALKHEAIIDEYIDYLGRDCSGHRNQILYNYFILLTYSHPENAEDMLFEVNSRFISPLPENAVQGIIGSVRRYHYRIPTNAKFIDTLDLPEFLQTKLNKSEAKRRTSSSYARIKAANARKKEQTISRVCYYYYNEHKSITEISRITGLSRTTIYKYLKANANHTELVEKFQERKKELVELKRTMIARFSKGNIKPKFMYNEITHTSEAFLMEVLSPTEWKEFEEFKNRFYYQINRLKQYPKWLRNTLDHKYVYGY